MIFIGYPHRKRTVPFRVLVPNMLTTVALCAGLASVHFSLRASALRAPHDTRALDVKLFEHPALATAARESIEAALEAAPRVGADPKSIEAVASYYDRYVARGRCPADDRLVQELA